MIATDTAGEVVRMNALAEYLTGWTLMDARGRHITEIFVLDESSRTGEHRVERATREHQAVGFDRQSVLLARSGRRTPITGTGAPIRDLDGSLRGSVLVFRDIGEERRAEELRTRSAELELQNRRMAEASRLKSEFLASMSHELRTPLNAILGFTDLLLARRVDPDSPEHDEFLGNIAVSGRHLLQLITDVLDLSKVEAGKLEFRPRVVGVGVLVGEVASILRPLAASRRIEITVDVDPELGEVLIDPGRFKQVLYNYLSNALKFSDEQSVVHLRVFGQGAEAFRLEVEDHGPGIAPADLGRLFLEFQQLATGVGRKHTGTGLGLALTRRLVEAQG
ncbi:MAG: histidine kinase dimerization/phospho-acceptor domain-containing protein, partial [Myxococcota bacterium]